MKSVQTKKQSGFTLIELVVVVAIVGILSAVLLSSVKGSTDGSKSIALIRAAEGVNNNLNLIAQACGISTAVTSNPLPDTGKTLSDVLFNGVANVVTAYKPCYGTSSAKALSESSQVLSAGKYSVQGFEATLAGGGSSAVQVGFLLVPEEITLAVVQKYSPAVATLDAAGATVGAVQYSAAGAGSPRTVTFLKQ